MKITPIQKKVLLRKHLVFNFLEGYGLVMKVMACNCHAIAVILVDPQVFPHTSILNTIWDPILEDIIHENMFRVP